MSKFREAMDVFDLKYGWGKVVDVVYDIDNEYTVRVEYPDMDEYEDYTEDGRWSVSYKYPTLFLESEVPKEWFEHYHKPLIKHEEVVYVNTYPGQNRLYMYNTLQEAVDNRTDKAVTREATVTWEE